MTTEHEFTGTIEITFTVKAVCRIAGFGNTPEAARNAAIVAAMGEAHGAQRLTPRITQAFWESPKISLAVLDESTVRETEFQNGDLRYVKQKGEQNANGSS